MNLIYDQAAYAILKNSEFILQWNRLRSNCHYATAFQEPAFVGAWYEAYRDKWRPIIVYSENSNLELSGLLLLAYDPNDRELVHAGSSQAEYHSWICLPGEEVTFLSKAFRELLDRYDFKRLRFRYFPEVGMLEEVITKLPMKDNIEIRRRPRPLMILNAEEIKASFAKKSNKSRFNRLKKLGKVDFYRIKDSGVLNNVFDELISFYDLRQGAINHSKPFHEDDNKRKFHVELFERAGEKAYVTVTCLNDRPIAGFWGLVSNGRVHLGMLMHSPFLAEHSIGKLHLMQLSEQLLNDGFDTLDLTPGSDPWKERFANAHDEVAEVILHRSVVAKTKGKVVYDVLNRIRQRANQFGLSTSDLKKFQNTIRSAGFSIFSKIWEWVRSDRKIHIYQIDRSVSNHLVLDKRINCNSLGDLLLFEDERVAQSENNFLSDALFRLEQGEKVYTISIDNRLVYAEWMRTNQANQQQINLPPDSITIHGLYIHPEFKQLELVKQSLQHLLHDAFSDQKTQLVFVFVPDENKLYRKSVEELGFSFKSSFVLTNRFGNEKIRLQ